MSAKPAVWVPNYTITPEMARRLMEVEEARAVVARTPLPPAVEAELRRKARVRATHHSTRIEGNRLTLAEAGRAIDQDGPALDGRERDVREVRNYWNALLRVEEWAEAKRPLTEDLIRRVHALVERGPRARPTPYRDGQNVIRDSATRSIVYLPPEARDVPGLMASLVRWVRQGEHDRIPMPLLAGLAHYQFVTIHPYFDGNGRAARLLATFLLHRGGYGLHGFFSLEDQYIRDLPAYYGALATHPHHNYYEGRAQADLTAWLGYFLRNLAQSFRAVREQAERLAAQGVPAGPGPLSRLDRRARMVLALFAHNQTITASRVAQTLGLSPRMARVLLKGWVEDGWLTVAEASRRKRSYGLSAMYRQFIGDSSAIDQGTE